MLPGCELGTNAVHGIEVELQVMDTEEGRGERLA